MKRLRWLGILTVLAFWIATGWTSEPPDRGAAQMELYGGKSGKVPFPHHLHQENQADCMACHSLFPQESGAVERLKGEGTLKTKQVMNKLCVKCHRELKKAKQPSGPVTCKTCHIKD